MPELRAKDLSAGRFTRVRAAADSRDRIDRRIKRPVAPRRPCAINLPSLTKAGIIPTRSVLLRYNFVDTDSRASKDAETRETRTVTVRRCSSYAT